MGRGSHPHLPTLVPAVLSLPHTAPFWDAGCSLGLFPIRSRLSLTPRQRGRRPGLPAGVSQEPAEKGLHHGEVVSAVSPWNWGSWCPPNTAMWERWAGSRAGSHGRVPWGDPCRDGGPWGLGVPRGGDTSCDPPMSPCSGQKYLTAVVKLLGPLTRNYYIRAILHAA